MRAGRGGSYRSSQCPHSDMFQSVTRAKDRHED